MPSLELLPFWLDCLPEVSPFPDDCPASKIPSVEEDSFLVGDDCSASFPNDSSKGHGESSQILGILNFVGIRQCHGLDSNVDSLMGISLDCECWDISVCDSVLFLDIDFLPMLKPSTGDSSVGLSLAAICSVLFLGIDFLSMLKPSTGDSSMGLSFAAICSLVPVFRVWELRGEKGGWELRGEEGGEKGEEEGGWELRGEEGAVTGRRGSVICKMKFC